MKEVLQIIKDYWFMITFISMVVVSWTTFSSRLSAVENDVTEIKSSLNEVKKINEELTLLKIKIERIDTNIDFIKKQIQ